jgi:hypothetical protein
MSYVIKTVNGQYLIHTCRVGGFGSSHVNTKPLKVRSSIIKKQYKNEIKY